MSSPPRRSGRTRTTNKKYASTGWSKETLRLLRESSESSNPTSVDSEGEPSENDDEFDEQRLQAASVNEEEAEDDLSVASGSSKSSHVATPRNEDEDGLSIAIGEEEGGDTGKSVRWKPQTQTHSRGVTSVERGRSVKGGIWQLMFGPDAQDLTPMLTAKDRWLYKIRDTTLPSWKTLDEANKAEWSKNDNSDEINGNQDISSQAKKQQILHCLSFDEAKKRYTVQNGRDHQTVLGPYSKQQVYDLPFWKPLKLGKAWKKSPEDSSSSYHSGWLLNLGEKPQCMAWAPFHSVGQYLAISCRSTPAQRNSVPVSETVTSPAFSPSAPYPTCVQIWKFATISSKAAESCLDLVTSPRLIKILLCNSGDVKQMAWAPRSSSSVTADYGTSLGVLTILTTDGCVRLLSVPNQNSLSQEPICLEVRSPMLRFEPPKSSIFTCFTFGSPTDLILGTSSGHVHIYNISQPPDQTKLAKPYLTHQLHQTYVMSVSTLEDEYSHFLASSSAAGTLQLIDLRSPEQDILTIPRARVPTRNLIFNPHCRAVVTSIDSSGNTEPRGNAQTTLVAHNFRHFYSATALSKFPEGNGTATALAGSSLHPFILVGNSSGTVWAQNIVRRILPTGKPGAKNDGGAWVQKVIEYAWIPQPSSSTQQNSTPSDNASSPNEKTDLHHGKPVRLGVSRMHHGFKPEKLDLSNAGSKKRKAFGDGAIQVVFEEEQAVTAIEWNCNPVAASWCAIGWGSGVVLVTDLGHDTP